MDQTEITKINLQPHLQELHDLLYLLYSIPEASPEMVDYHQKVLQKVIPKIPKYYLIDLEKIGFK